MVAHYKKPFLPDAEYHTEWVEEKKRWYPVQRTKTVISGRLSKSVNFTMFSKPKDIRAKQRKAVQERGREFQRPINVDELE